MSGRDIHRGGTFLFSLLMFGIGLALTVQALASSAVLSGRLLLGVLFIAAGAGRTYVEVRRGRGT